MTTRIILRDNATSGSVPIAAALDQAELVINTADGRLFTKNASGQIILLNSQAGGSGGAADWTTLTGKPTGLVSSSVQAAAWTVATASVALNVSNNIVGFTKPTFVIEGGDVVPRDLVTTASLGLMITSGTGVLNNRVINWVNTPVTTSAANSIIFVTPNGIVSSSVTNGAFIAESDNKLILHRSFVDVPNFGSRIYAVEGSKTYNRISPRGELNTYRLQDYVVTTGDYSGSVAMDTSKSRVQYYFANVALLNFVKEYPEIVRGHLDNQILRHYATGTGTGETDWVTLHGTTWATYFHWPFDVNDPTGTPVKVRADSHDSYAATFALLAVKYAREVPGGLAWWDANFQSILNALYYNILIRERFVGAGYLTSVYQDLAVYDTLLTFDNMEVYAAVREAFKLMNERGGTQATEAATYAGTQTNILNGLRDAWTGTNSGGHTRYAYSGSAWITNNLEKLYPDLSVHSGYALYDIPETLASAVSDRGARQGRANDILLNLAEGWYNTRQYDLFPNGYVPASLVSTGHEDIGYEYLEFVATHVAYDAPLRYGVNEIGWVKRIQDELNTNTTTLNANFVSGSFSGPVRSTSFVSASALISNTVGANSGTFVGPLFADTMLAQGPLGVRHNSGSVTGYIKADPQAGLARIGAETFNIVSVDISGFSKYQFGTDTVVPVDTNAADLGTSANRWRSVNAQSVTASLQGTASFAVSASWAPSSGGSSDYNTLTNVPVGIVSSSAQLSGSTLNANTIVNPLLQNYTEVVTYPSMSANTLNLDLSTANVFDVLVNQNITTMTISNPPSSSRAESFTLIARYDGTRTIAWNSAIKWAGGTAPTISTTSGSTDIFTFITNNAGGKYYGVLVGKGF